ncbi:MAG: hypothetical protein K8S23_03260 [Candidatus Cloacimonetes bacterium]|nr:hypothetical protein [Candidatus Cloacimonadota bacterium]
MKRLLLFTLSFILLVSLFAQSANSDIFEVNTHHKKSAKKAMVMSSIFPGAGQIYANPKSITGYIFPAIEIGLWVGFLHFNNKGKDKESDYEYYANGELINAYHYTNEDGEYIYKEVYRYDRERQTTIQEDLIHHANNPFYTNHFRLDAENTQHFYEDIGKYNKYIFGWYDWYNIYGMNELGEDVLPSSGDNTHWNWDSNTNMWLGNEPTNPTSTYYTSNADVYDANNGVTSIMRAEYISMRQNTEDDYTKSDYMMFGILANHILAAIDAVRVTKKTNLASLSKNNIKINLAPVFVQNRLSAGLTFEKRF